MENNKNFGYRIRTIMENLSLQEFADSINVTVRALSNYLAGRVPRKSVLQKICDRYGVVPRWLLTGEGPMYKTDFPASESENVRRVAQNILGEDVQHIENINIEENKNVRRVAQTGNTDILDRYLRAVDENNTLIRENADLRIQLERKDSRIRDLERENAEIPELKARIAELERELSERPKLPKTVPVDVSAKSKPTPAHGTGTDTAVVPGAGAGVSGVGNLGAVVRRNGE